METENIKEAKKAIGKAIRLYIQKAKKQGTIGMSIDNLFMCVPPCHEAYRAFNGTNGRFQYKQEFYNVAGKVAGNFVF